MAPGPRICVDCAPLLVRSAGVKTYLYHWVRALQTLEPERVRTFLAPSRVDRLDHDGGPRKYPVRIAALLALNALPRFVCDLAIPECDVFHVSNQIRQLPRTRRVTTTIHDMTSWLMPEFHTEDTVRADRALQENVLRRAAGLIAVSENTRQDAIRLAGIAPEKIRVIHLGVPEAYFSVPPAEVDRVRAAYGLTRPYFLFVGTIEPRKNVDRLLDAWCAMTAEFRHTHELLIVGMSGWRAEGTGARLAQLQAEGEVRYLGYADEANLPGLTAGALGFVYPSLYEGFGIPVAQAMAAGCPVITSNNSSLPEVTGGAALLVDALSAGEIARAMEKLAGSDELRERLTAQARAVAQRYRWEIAAARSLEFFGEVCG